MKNEKVKHFFQKDFQLHKMNKRSKNLLKIKKTKQFEQSATPYMIKLINEDNKKKKSIEKID